MLTSVAVIFVLLVLSAFFSGSETALTAASRPLMHQLESQGNRRAAIVNRLHESKDRLIGALLIGNNLVNISASTLATGVLIALFGEAGIAYATLAMTLLILVFSEILPKTYAFHHANRAALFLAPAVGGLVYVLAPVTQAFQWVVRGTIRLFGGRLETDGAMAPTVEELRGAIELHEGEAPSVRHERAMLRSVLDLAELTVGDIMTHRKNVIMIDADEPPDAVVNHILASPFTRIPLWRDNPDNIIGVVHAKDLLRAVWARGPNLAGLDLVGLAAKPWFIPDSTTLLDQLQAFRHRREHFALVVDEYGVFLGIVTLEDILEEIVGDIADEHDIPVAGVRPQPDGSYIVDGTVPIRDLNRQLDWRLPDDNATTVAGLVLHESRRIPDVGQVFLFYGFRFEILRRQRNQIAAIRVTPPKGEEAEAGTA